MSRRSPRPRPRGARGSTRPRRPRATATPPTRPSSRRNGARRARRFCRDVWRLLSWPRRHVCYIMTRRTVDVPLPHALRHESEANARARQARDAAALAERRREHEAEEAAWRARLEAAEASTNVTCRIRSGSLSRRERHRARGSRRWPRCQCWEERMAVCQCVVSVSSVCRIRSE